MKRLAQSRIDILWKLAVDASVNDPKRAREYMQSARKIAQKARIKLPRDYSRRLCKECGTLLVPGRNSRFRVRHNRSTHLTMTCLNCGSVRRFPVIRES
ncbi:MAG: ribonuclease P protein component 4 [Candidatus Thorarchaeota archaeon]